MYRFLMSKRYVNLLFLIGADKNLHQLSKDADMTYSHLSNVTDQWQKEGIIVKIRKGREIEIKITEFGKKAIEIVREFDDLAKKQMEKISRGEQ
jgi:molybdenum-dependent DNA-binding transcriptional regulator ModE